MRVAIKVEITEIPVIFARAGGPCYEHSYLTLCLCRYLWMAIHGLFFGVLSINHVARFFFFSLGS